MWRIPPYEYIADDGESIVGFEVDILAYIAEKLGMELEIIDMEFGSVLTSVQTAKAFVAANEGLHVLDTAYALEDYAFAIAKENTELLEQVNAILEEMIADGTMAQMKAVYIK